MSVSRRPVTGSGKRALVALAMGAIASPLAIGLTAGPASAAVDISSACPEGAFDDAGFTDVATQNEQFQVAINCLAALGITTGETATTFNPTGTITRAQMAQFLFRLGELVGFTWDVTDAGFEDVAGASPEAQEAINALKNAGVVNGKTATTYDPVGQVRRDQMATFLAQFQANVLGEELAPGAEDAFTDDEGNIHEANINAIAAADIADGFTEDTYGPGQAVTRAQMAAFVTRHIAVAVNAGLIDPPFDPPATPNQTFTVTGGETLDAPGTVTYTVTGITSETVDIALVASADVTDTDGVISFTGAVAAGGPGTDARITSVNGVEVTTPAVDDYVSDVLVLGGSVQFTVASDAAVSVTPVVFDDADDDDALAVDEAGLPTEAFGVGGAADFIAIAGITLTPQTETVAFGSQATVTAQLVDAAGGAVAVAERTVRFEVVRGGTLNVDGTVSGGTVIAIGGVQTDVDGTATFTVDGPADPTPDVDDPNVTDLVQAWYDADSDALLDADEFSDISSVTFSDDAPDAVGAVVVDDGTAGVLDEADTVVLSFGETVLAESSITVTDADGDMTVLSDEQATDTAGDGVTPVTVTGSGTMILRFALTGPVDVTTTATSDGVLTLPLAITAATGITSEATGTSFDPAADPEVGNVPAGQDPAAPAAAVVTTPAAATTTNQLTFDIVGTAEAGATVSVGNATGQVGTGTADATGAFTVNVPLVAGENAFTVVVTDTEGFASVPTTVPTITQDVTAPTAAAVTDPAGETATNAATFDIVGTAEAGAAVSVTDALGVEAGTATADAGGAFTVTVPLAEGPNDFTVVATDPAGNESAPTTVPTITRDVTAPGAATGVSPTAATTTNDPTFAITGTGEAGATVLILESATRAQLGTGTADATGAFSVDPALAEGPNNVVIVVRDAAGNESADTTVPTITQDTTAPLATDAGGVVNVANTANMYGDEVGDTVGVLYDGAVAVDLAVATARIDSDADGTADGTIDCANVNVDCALNATTNTVTFRVVNAALAAADQVSVMVGSAAAGSGSTVTATTGITDPAGNPAAGYPVRIDAGD